MSGYTVHRVHTYIHTNVAMKHTDVNLRVAVFRRAVRPHRQTDRQTDRQTSRCAVSRFLLSVAVNTVTDQMELISYEAISIACYGCECLSVLVIVTCMQIASFVRRTVCSVCLSVTCGLSGSTTMSHVTDLTIMSQVTDRPHNSVSRDRQTSQQCPR
jgi:hypothetical protein